MMAGSMLGLWGVKDHKHLGALLGPPRSRPAAGAAGRCALPAMLAAIAA